MKIIFLEKIVKNNKIIELNSYTFDPSEENLNFFDYKYLKEEIKNKIEIVDEMLNNYLKNDTYNLNENIKQHSIFELLLDKLIELKYEELELKLKKNKQSYSVLYLGELVFLPLNLEQIKEIIAEALKSKKSLLVEIENNLDKGKVSYKIIKINQKQKKE
jgi:hypothetical protein